MSGADVVVVGLGAVGSAIVRGLAERGVTVTGIDRFRPPHDRGSSHGATRITRLAIGEGHEYVPLARRSHVLWRELEAETGATLMHTTGLLLLAAPDADAAPFHGRAGFFERTVDAARRFGIAHECLDAREVARRWPAFSPQPVEHGYHERDAGVLHPEACVQAQLEMARRRGATLRFDERVLRIEACGARVAVATERAHLEAAHVVLAAGAWLPGLLPSGTESGYAVQRQALHWFRSARPAWHAPDAMPPFVWMHGRGGEAFYGFPMVDGEPGVKLATEQSTCTTDPDAMERHVTEAESTAVFESHVRGRLRGIEATTVRTAACLYTCRPEGRFLVDRHPSLAHVTVVSACSGHGFKHSAALGEAVADRLAGRTPRVDLTPFAASPATAST